MTSARMVEALRHLRDLFNDGTSVGMDDGRLLARYADARDEAAFEALVARHGPMVLATCRAVLRNEHDDVDAFQANFLVLARKARMVRAGDALGGWLHRVAYRAAVQARAESRRRRHREAEATAMATRNAIHNELDPDFASVVHEEIHHLPDRQRLPVVLCDLEGLTYEEAARHLRWTEPTLRHRLVKARQRLRDRLNRRGVTAGAVGIALAAPATGAMAAVPAALARSAVAAAMGGVCTATTTALANTIIRSMLMTGAETIKGFDRKLMSFRTRPQYWNVGNYHAVAELTLDPKAKSATLDVQVDTGRTIAVAPVDPEGRPVSGTRASGVSDLFSSTEYAQQWSTIEIYALHPSRPRRVIVRHAGRKLIGSVYLKGDEAGPLTIQLQLYGTITGRIVDEDGRPRGGLGITSIGGSMPARPAEQGIPARRQYRRRHPGRPRRPLPHRGPRPGSQVWRKRIGRTHLFRRAVPRLDRYRWRSQGSGRPQVSSAQGG